MFKHGTKRICPALVLGVPLAAKAMAAVCSATALAVPRRFTMRSLLASLFLLAFCVPAAETPTAKGGALGVRTNDNRKQFTLSAETLWHLNVNRRFDASALTFYQGKLLTIDDRDGGVYELTLGTNSIAEAKGTDLFARRDLMKVAPKRSARFDCEGLATDGSGNLYLSEESQRVIYKRSSDGKLDAIVIDWSPVQRFFGTDVNASFEGIAVNGNRMYVANERSAARVVVIDLNERKVMDSFFVDSTGFAFGGPHYTDLAFAEGRLFILNRNHRCIFEIEPETKRVLAEYSFAQMELDKAVAYFTDYPTGTMEGLAVDREHFWMITDNNGKGRIADAADSRPTLFRCKRPR
jgi:hypothetical protein